MAKVTVSIARNDGSSTVVSPNFEPVNAGNMVQATEDATVDVSGVKKPAVRLGTYDRGDVHMGLTGQRPSAGTVND